MEPVIKQSLVAAHLEGKHNDRHRERCASCRDRIFIQLCDCGKHPEGVGWTQDPQAALNSWGEGGFFEAKKSECTFGTGGLVIPPAGSPQTKDDDVANEQAANDATVENDLIEALTTSEPPAAEAFYEEDASGVVTPGGVNAPIPAKQTKRATSKGEQVKCDPQPKKAPREAYPGKWEPLAQAAGGPMFLAKKLGISYITLRKVVRRNKSGNPDLVARVQKVAAEFNVESPL